MATLHTGVVTPWLSKEEWTNVYHALFSEKPNIRWALDRIAVWKSRSSPNLLSEIDATEAVFRAKTYEFCELSRRDTYSNSMLYSSALMRFVKLIADIGQKKGIDAVNRAARQLGVPEWVVTLRHDVTHSNIPPFEMLSLGIDFALRWLKSYYWDKEIERLNSMIPAPDSIPVGTDESIRKDIDRFCILQLQKDSYNADDIAILVKPLYSKVKHHSAAFSKILAEPGYLLPAYEQLKSILDENEMEFLNNKSTMIPDSLLKFWAPLLKLYDMKPSYYSLLHNLLECSQLNCTSLQRRLIAAWVVKIFNSSKTINKKSLLKVPSLDWSKILTQALVCYNEYSPAYLTLILEDSSVVIPEDKKQHLMALVAIRLGKTMDALPSSIAKETIGVYTTDDLQKSKLCREENSIEDNEIYWKISTEPIDWRMYPIGLLPGQTVPNIFDKVHVKEQLENSISEDMNITCNVEEIPEMCFQSINTIEDSEPISMTRTLKHIMFF